MEHVYDDGGRKAAGYKGSTGDCATRAIAIACEIPYQDAYELVAEIGSRDRITKRRKSKSHPRTGVYSATMRRIMEHLGWTWVPTMQIGSGCTVHMRADELPAGRLILNVSKHFTACIDGVIHDTYCDDRDGTRCVYGYWYKKG